MGLLEREYMKQRTDAESQLSDELPDVDHTPESPKRVDPFSGMVLEGLPLAGSNGNSTNPERNTAVKHKHASPLYPSWKAVSQAENGRLPNLNVYILVIVVLIGIITVLIMR